MAASSSSTFTPFRSIECCAVQATAATSVASFPTRAYLGCRLLSLQRAPHASIGARFISVLSVSTGRSVRRNAILALDPDFYKIPYVEGVPVGNRLKLWNLPPNCDHGELHEWLNSIPDVNAVTLEFTDDPDLNAQGVGGFVEFGTKQEACMAIVRLDGRKFKGRCIRMDFVEKRPHEREIGGRRNRPSRNYSRGGSYSGSSSSLVQNFEPRGTYSGGGGIGSPTVATGDGSIGTTGSPIPSPVATSYSPPPPPPPRSYGPPPTSHRVFVGNLSWSIDDNGLQSLFRNHGTVLEARVMRDRETGNSRGFGFVAMSTAEEMNSAISALDGKQVEGRTLKVNVASR